MEEDVEVLARLRRLVTGQRFCALATLGEMGPYANLVAYAATDDLRQIVFATGRATRKFSNLVGQGRVALLFDDRSNRATDLREAIAATATGEAVPVGGSERRGLEDLLLGRHPELGSFVRSQGAAIVRVDVQTYYVVTRFQNVLEFHVTEAGVEAAQAGEPPRRA